MTGHRSPGRVASLVATYLLPVAVLAVSFTLHQVRGIDFGTVSRDIVTQYEAYPLVGAQSQIGGMLWFSGAVAGLLAVLVLRRTGHGREERTRLLAALTALLLMLGVDDVFLLHDGLFPEYLGIDERPVEVFYLLSIVGIGIRFWRTVLRHDPVLLGLAVSFLAGSILVDHFQEALEGHAYRIFYEDGFKLLGIAGFAGYMIRQSALALQSLVQPPAPLAAGPVRTRREARAAGRE